jgi:hypothetical protein
MGMLLKQSGDGPLSALIIAGYCAFAVALLSGLWMWL